MALKKWDFPPESCNVDTYVMVMIVNSNYQLAAENPCHTSIQGVIGVAHNPIVSYY